MPSVQVLTNKQECGHTEKSFSATQITTLSHLKLFYMELLVFIQKEVNETKEKVLLNTMDIV